MERELKARETTESYKRAESRRSNWPRDSDGSHRCPSPGGAACAWPYVLAEVGVTRGPLSGCPSSGFPSNEEPSALAAGALVALGGPMPGLLGDSPGSLDDLLGRRSSSPPRGDRGELCRCSARPVLKHGPRSPPVARVIGWKTQTRNESDCRGKLVTAAPCAGVMAS